PPPSHLSPLSLHDALPIYGRPRNPHKFMGTAIEFDLNAALRQWRESLGQSPHVRPENLDELESHLRDSVASLQTKGLAADEAFLDRKSTRLNSSHDQISYA